jgi:Tol biopolymer transport system component
LYHKCGTLFFYEPLVEIDEGYDTGRRAELRNLTTGENWTIVTGSGDRPDFDFSADNRWALVFSTVRAPGTEDEDQHTLYVIHTADGSIREIADAINAFFSPDSTQLAYTVRQTGGNLEMYVMPLDGEAVQSLGPGMFTGWFSLGIMP